VREECRDPTADFYTDSSLPDTANVERMSNRISTQAAERGLAKLEDDIVRWRQVLVTCTHMTD
jgi:hypothetical protein